jgi:hypothetical protein
VAITSAGRFSPLGPVVVSKIFPRKRSKFSGRKFDSQDNIIVKREI